VAYGGRRAGRYRIFFKRADGAGEEVLFLEDPANDVWPVDASADGRWLAFGKGAAAGTAHGSLWMTSLTGSAAPQQLVPVSDDFQGAQFSRDGKWLAFSANVSGRTEVYVSPVPTDGQGLEARWQVSGSGGDRPRWRADGRELYYVRPDGMIMAVAVDGAGAEFRAEGEKALFQAFQRIFGRPSVSPATVNGS
jgi:Tol biopolymer transport system component